MQILHTKLTTKTEAGSNQIKSAVLYDGSITIFDSRLYGFDIGTCLEVSFLALNIYVQSLLRHLLNVCLVWWSLDNLLFSAEVKTQWDCVRPIHLNTYSVRDTR